MEQKITEELKTKKLVQKIQSECLSASPWRQPWEGRVGASVPNAGMRNKL